jgi:predicted lipid-binding transport protein (Tim44 family)
MAQAPGGLSARSGYGERPVPPLGGMGLGGGLPGGARAQPAPAQAPVQVAPEDFDAFERTLHEVQDAYNRQDVAALWTLATPEMAGYFQEQLNDNAREGVVDRVSGIKLLQGDLSEAWREGETEYATVAMRFALTEGHRRDGDRPGGVGQSERADRSHRDLDLPPRPRGPWKLSAIQQTT